MLTAIVISFGMTAVLMIMAIGGHLEAGHDRVNMADDDEPNDDASEGRGHDEPLDHRPRRPARRWWRR